MVSQYKSLNEELLREISTKALGFEWMRILSSHRDFIVKRTALDDFCYSGIFFYEVQYEYMALKWH